jgi:6-pyruvoyltetrahydropterin/6-carboxytetrahydropterin synthase
VTCEVGLSRSVHAFHIMPGLPGPEGELHDHDYRIDIVADREQLDERL